ncbi:Uu.00g005420.m01.CDS01 [Anthostomella pinea]|uniref:Uu.00g005420.m01.CDS01 n=1 Tax=Anthostomella pinea TaxID=933095 RepID=A0AAI8VKR6_9PEZI|nr:Uu.00g005420.m01.CDS01 [Anthostomella pinea]
MAGYVGKFVTNKILGETLQNKFGVEDPYFETVPATRLDGKPSRSKTKKIHKAIPPGLSEHDANILNKVKRRAYRLDMAFGSFMGLKLGWGSIIGIFPVAGDIADGLLAMLVVRTAQQIEGGLPFDVKLMMYFWVILDLIIGAVPILGDIGDALILANTRNAAALEKHLRKKGMKNLQASGLPVPDVDPSDPAEFDRFHSSGSPTSSQPARHDKVPAGRTRDDTPQSSGVAAAPAQPPRPAQAKVRADRQGGSGGGFFGFGGKKSRPADIEAGTAGQTATAKQSRRG